MLTIDARVLEGRFVCLEPLVAGHKEELRAAMDADIDAHALFPSPFCAAHFDGAWQGRLEEIAAGRWISYAVRRRADGAVVGTTSYLNLRWADRGLEVGGTFYRPDARGGPVNPECKLLMLGQAFDAGAMRVELVTDARNSRSAAAIAKLGAKRDGVLRQHKLTWTGHRRDTMVFSILDSEWPAVKAGLEARLA